MISMNLLNAILLSANYPDGDKGVTLDGISNVEYWLGGLVGWILRWIAKYSSFSWQVKFSVCMVAIGIIVVLYMLYSLFRDIRKRHMMRRIEIDTYNRFCQPFREVMECRETLKEEDIERICDMTKEKIIRFPHSKESIAIPVLASVIMRVRLEMIKKYDRGESSAEQDADTEIFYLPNISTLCGMTGVTALYEMNLEKRRDVVKTLQDLLTLTLPVTEGYLARYTGHGNKDIKYMARMCYVICTKAEPYKYMEEDLKGSQPLWYPMMLHRLLGWLKQTGHPMPKFALMAAETKNEESAAFLIKEIGFWGSDEDKKSLVEFLHSSSHRCVEATLDVLGVKGNVEAEAHIMDVYGNQTEQLRRACLRAVSRIQSGQGTDFFTGAFEESSSLETKACALECLYTYGRSGMMRFIELSNKYESDESLSELIYEVSSVQIAKQAGLNL